MGSPILEYACDRFLDNPVLYRGDEREVFVTTPTTPDGFAPRLGRFVTNVWICRQRDSELVGRSKRKIFPPTRRDSGLGANP